MLLAGLPIAEAAVSEDSWTRRHWEATTGAPIPFEAENVKLKATCAGTGAVWFGPLSTRALGA